MNEEALNALQGMCNDADQANPAAQQQAAEQAQAEEQAESAGDLEAWAQHSCQS
jgi:hypothetical protein